MGIEATTTSVSTTAAMQSSASSSPTSKTNSSDSSFKEEMNKVSDTKTEGKTTDKKSDKPEGKAKTDASDKSNLEHIKSEDNKNKLENASNAVDSHALDALNGQLLMSDASMMLTNNIQQMMDNTLSVNSVNLKNWTIGVGDGKQTNLTMNESDADFFINLTQNDNVNIQGITAQAQNMLNNGAEISDVKQNVQVSQALLNALSEARENNQPIRIDFDKNISVILRVGRDGAVSAQFIPGDKAVEQYLRNNIESLKSSFDEQDLPYSELSYSHSSKEQNQRRRQEKQQGE